MICLYSYCCQDTSTNKGQNTCPYTEHVNPRDSSCRWTLSGNSVFGRQIFPREAVCSVHLRFYTSIYFVPLFCYCEHCYFRWFFLLGRENHHFLIPKSRFLDTWNFTFFSSIKFPTLILRPKGNINSDQVFITKKVYVAVKLRNYFRKFFSVSISFLEIRCIPNFLYTFSEFCLPSRMWNILCFIFHGIFYTVSLLMTCDLYLSSE